LESFHRRGLWSDETFRIFEYEWATKPCVRWLSKSPPDIDAAVACAERAARAGRHIAAMVERMRQQAVRADPVNIREQVDEALAQLEHEILLYSVTVVEEFDEDLPLVRADRVAVQQVLINLILNGIIFMTGHGDIAMGCKQ
jgi:signal transduction histidine kinase